MNIQAIVIAVDPSEPLRLQEIDKQDLDAYRDLVGGNIEVINFDRPPASLYFNEEGKLEEFPVNPRATTLLWAHNSAFRGHDHIVGPAFIVGPVDGRGDDKTVPQALIDLFFNTKTFKVEVQVNERPGWSGNEERFTDWFEAYVYGVQLAQRWTAVDEVRVVSADE